MVPSTLAFIFIDSRLQLLQGSADLECAVGKDYGWCNVGNIQSIRVQ